MNIHLLRTAVAICLVVGTLTLSAAPRRPQSTATNLTVLKGMSDDDLFQVMQTFSAQTGMTCNGCHVAGNNASDDKAQKVTARKMYAIVQLLNEQDFFKNGNRKADCYLCHKGAQRPAKTPLG